jgi:hypothetical protein
VTLLKIEEELETELSSALLHTSWCSLLARLGSPTASCFVIQLSGAGLPIPRVRQSGCKELWFYTAFRFGDLFPAISSRGSLNLRKREGYSQY